MKHPFCILLLYLFSIACSSDKVKQSVTEDLSEASKSIVDSILESSVSYVSTVNTKLFMQLDTNKSYYAMKAEIQSIKTAIDTNIISKDSLSFLFTELLVKKIIPYWYGTTWSFEGHTSVPGVGEIACGYFVSTTLRDLGLNINRYLFAQQLPVNEAKSLSMGNSVIEISKSTVNENIAEIRKKLKNGIYFIGLDHGHVGYLYKKDRNLYFIHSNYASVNGVEIEKIEESIVFTCYYRYYIAPISTNKDLLRKWISNEKIEIVTN